MKNNLNLPFTLKLLMHFLSFENELEESRDNSPTKLTFPMSGIYVYKPKPPVLSQAWAGAALVLHYHCVSVPREGRGCAKALSGCFGSSLVPPTPPSVL